ncbi:MAG: hypothetical protein IKI20_09155 [Lachnospiraceae bacterium]|nr:hypothetical protein [Lachnospiraceae bacterium]
MSELKNELSYEEFQDVLKEKVQNKLDERIAVGITDVMKNNGVVLKGMTFSKEGEGISPTIYLEQYYVAYKKGADWAELVRKIVDIFHLGAKNEFFDLQAFLDFERAKEHIVYKLVNYEKNKELLEKIPHRQFLDMAVVYYYLVETEELSNATILIYNNHLENWNVTAEELDAIAKENTPKLLKEDLRSMTEVIRELLRKKGIPEEEIFTEEPEEEVMYVLSNNTQVFGAAAILYSGVLKAFAKKVKKDLLILPSSVHEVIILPKSDDMNVETLRQMVMEVNSTQVEEVEVLSDNVYCYERKTDALTFAKNIA